LPEVGPLSAESANELRQDGNQDNSISRGAYLSSSGPFRMLELSHVYMVYRSSLFCANPAVKWAEKKWSRFAEPFSAVRYEFLIA
jgi:hypothetical protein